MANILKLGSPLPKQISLGMIQRVGTNQLTFASKSTCKNPEIYTLDCDKRK